MQANADALRIARLGGASRFAINLFWESCV